MQDVVTNTETVRNYRGEEQLDSKHYQTLGFGYTNVPSKKD